MKTSKVKIRNFVQEHVMLFNCPKIFCDRKKAMKSGYQKHKSDYRQNWRQL